MAHSIHEAPSGTPTPVAIADLGEQVRGRIIQPRDEDYEAARAIRIGGIDRHPAAIVRVADATDVSHVVTFAREHGIHLAVRSGGHSLAGHGVVDEGIVLDLSELDSLDIDAEGRTAWAGTGLSTGEYTVAAAEHGLATGFGDTGTVGIGGITLAGGIGYLVRKHGLTIDNLLAAEIVTADGVVRYVDSETEPDLFWAIRGGGGNFGVATRFRFRMHPVDTIVGGMLILPATPDTIAGFAAEADAAPEELSTIAMVLNAPPMPFLPEEAHGKRILMSLMAYAGDVDAGERAIAPFRNLAEPIADMVGPKRYPDMFPPEEDFRPTAATHTMFMDRIDREVASAMLDHIETATSPMAAVQFRVLGGAMARVPEDATAFAHRQAPIMVNIVAAYATPDDIPTQQAWVEALTEVLRQGDDKAYTGFLSTANEASVRAAYPGATWARLSEIKRKYDPTNLFRHNHNIPPGSENRNAVTAARARTG